MLFSRSGRNSQSDARPSESRAGSVLPMLSVVEHVDTTLANDDGISKFLTSLSPTDSAKPFLGSSFGTNGSAAPTGLAVAKTASRPPKSAGGSTGVYAKYEEMINSSQSRLMAEMHEREKLLTQFDALNKDYDTQSRQLLTTTETSRKYQDELRTLQQAQHESRQSAAAIVSTSNAFQKTDDHFREEMQKLSASVHNWVWNHFRNAELRLSKASKDDVALIEELLPSGADAAHVPKLQLLQAITMSPIVKLLQDPFFVGLPATYSTVTDAYALLRKVSTPAAFEHWRAATVAALDSSSDTPLTKATKDLTTHVAKGTTDLLLSMTEAADKEELAAELETIVSTAIGLAREFRSQHSHFSFSLPEKKESKFIPFDSGLMETGDSAAADGSSKVRIVLSPVVLKARDETSVKKTVVVKAKVVCEKA